MQKQHIIQEGGIQEEGMTIPEGGVSVCALCGSPWGPVCPVWVPFWGPSFRRVASLWGAPSGVDRLMTSTKYILYIYI